MISDPVAELRLPGAPTVEHIDLEVLDGFRFPDGEGFPDSYRAFVRHAGWGRAFGMWLVYPPVLPGYADGLHGRGERLTARFRASYREGEAEGFDWMIEPDGLWSLAATLEVFGWSENGDALLWNTASRDANGEFAVWESRGGNSLHHLGAGLRQALRWYAPAPTTPSGPARSPWSLSPPPDSEQAGGADRGRCGLDAAGGTLGSRPPSFASARPWRARAASPTAPGRRPAAPLRPAP